MLLICNPINPGKAFVALISAHIALPVNRLRYACHGAGSAQGRPVAAAPCTPGLRPAKSPLRGPFDLSLQASGRAEAASVQNTALSPHPCGLPRPSGNVSAILRPSAPAVSARMVNKLTAGRTNRRPDKRSAIRHKGGYGAGGSFPAALRLPGREWDSAERFAKKHLPPSNRKAG